jgi:general secretion pathway protein A
MYSQHFALAQDPFSIAPDPRFLFMSERHREALAHLVFGLNGNGGFVLLTGDIGTGKTTVCRCFLEQIPPQCRLAMVFNPRLSALELLQTIGEEFHIPLEPKANAKSLKTHVDALNRFLLEGHAAGQTSVLIIDEAQNLSAEVLEQLRLLTNLETHERKLLQVVLIGQPELRNMLQRPELEQLAQRVVARYHLGPLNAAETQRYIQHRLTVAGHRGALPFDAGALRRIHALSGGVPRRINLLCGRSLLGAWANGLHRVDRRMVDKAVTEVMGRGQVKRMRTSLADAAAPVMFGAGLLLLALAGVMQYVRTPARPLPIAPSTRAAEAMPAATALVPVAPAASSPARALAAVDDVANLFYLMPNQTAPAWQMLSPPGRGSTSAAATCGGANPGPPCFRFKLNLPLLRQLDRPGVLTLQDADGQIRYAVLQGLGDDTATLQWPGSTRRVTLLSLARFWRGEYAGLWQPPPGYLPRLRVGEVNPALSQFASLLAQFEGRPQPAGTAPVMSLDASLRQRIQVFQKAQGIEADGLPGPMTWMLLERALGLAHPSLREGAS